MKKLHLAIAICLISLFLGAQLIASNPANEPPNNSNKELQPLKEEEIAAEHAAAKEKRIQAAIDKYGAAQEAARKKREAEDKAARKKREADEETARNKREAADKAAKLNAAHEAAIKEYDPLAEDPQDPPK